MKADAFRELSREEVGQRIEDLREQLLKLRFQKSTGQIENPQTIRSVRRDLARALTVQREMELEQQRPAGQVDDSRSTGAAVPE